MELNGVCAIKVIAYDGNGRAYESKIRYITVLVNRQLSLKGISEGKSITKAICDQSRQKISRSNDSGGVRA